MNKLFTKVAALTLGVAMAAGVGVALGSAKASEAKADEETVTLDFATAGLTSFASPTVNQKLKYSYAKISGNNNPVFTQAYGEPQYSLKLYAVTYLCIEIDSTGTDDYASFKSIQCAATSKNGTTAGTGDYFKDSLDSTALYSHALTTASFTLGNEVDMDGASKIYIKCSAGQYRIGKLIIKLNGATSTKQDTSVDISNPSTIHAKVGDDPIQISATTTPANLPLTYSSSQETVATVSDSGLVTILGVGTSVISANYAGDDTYKASSDSVTLIVEPAHITGKTVSEIVAETTSANATVIYDLECYVTAWASGTDGTQYGNFYVADAKGDTANQAYVYGANHGNGAVWNGTKYTFSNAKTFLTDEVTSQIVIGSKIKVEFIAFLYNNTTFELQGEILEILPDVPTAWTSEQENTFKTNLDGFVPKFFGPIDGDLDVDGYKVSFVLDGDKVSTVNEELATKGWESIGGGIYRDETEAGHGVVDGYAICNNDPSTQTEKTTVSFEYRQYFEVTITEGNESNKHNVPRGDNFELPQPTESLIPSGQQFKGWRVNSEEELRNAGDTLQEVEANATVVAVYEDIPVADWTQEQKTAMGAALEGYVPPFYGEIYHDEFSVQGHVVRFTVYGDLSSGFAASLGEGWTLTEGKYYKDYQEGQLIASLEVVILKGDPAVSEFRFEYMEAAVTEWTDEQKTQFAQVFDGVVPPFISAEFVEEMAIYPSSFAAYGEVASIDQTQLIKAAFDNDTRYNWVFHEESETEYPGYELATENGTIKVGYYYEDDATWLSMQYFATPTSSWSQDQIDAFNEKLKVVPPCFSDEVAEKLVWNDENKLFIAEGLTGNQQGAIYTALTDAGWTYQGQTSSGHRCSYSVEGGTAYAIFSAYYTDEEQTTIATDIVFYMQKTVTHLAVDTSAGKTKYVVGESLETAGYVVYGLAADESVVGTLPASVCTFAPTTFTEAGQVEVTVSYSTWSGTFTVNVVPLAVESVVVSGEMSKTQYVAGEDWDATGLVATAHYNDGSEVVVTDQVTWAFDPAETTAGLDSVAVTASFENVTSEAFNVAVSVEAPAPTYDADAFAKELLEKVAPICANYDGKKNNKTALKAVWTEMALKYETLSEEEKAKVVEAAAKTDGTDLEKAMAFYNYACKKYGLTKFIAGRQVKAIVNEQVSTGNSILPIIVIVAASVTAVTAIGVVIALKRRKNFLTK